MHSVFYVQTLEYVCDEYGGRVELAKAYYNGLSNSLQKISMEMESSLACSSAMTFSSSGRSKSLWQELVSSFQTQCFINVFFS